MLIINTTSAKNSIRGLLKMSDILGTTGNDTLIGTSGNDLIEGLAGKDTIDALAGNNVNPPIWTSIINPGVVAANLTYTENITTDSEGSIYVTGATREDLDGQTNNGGYDIFISKYSSDGNKVWTELLGTRNNNFASEYGYDIASDNGAIYVTGFTQGDLEDQSNTGNSKAYLTKYLIDGTKVWTELLGTSTTNISHAIGIGNDGSIYITGYTLGNLNGQTNSGGTDAFLAKYAPDGTLVWTRLLGTTAGEQANAIAIGNDDSIYIGGFTGGNLDGELNNGVNDGFIAKYQPDGTRIWTRLIGTATTDGVSSLAIGNDGLLYVGGNTNGNNLNGQVNNGGNDGFIVKYQPDGTRIWTRLIGTAETDAVNTLAIGNDGLLYVGGNTRGNLNGQIKNDDGDYDGFVVKYQLDGTELWTQLIGGIGYDDVKAITTGDDGTTYITGRLRDGRFVSEFVSVIDKISAPNLAITSRSANKFEGDSNSTEFTFTVTRTNNLTATNTVKWQVGGFGDNSANEDDFGGVFPSGSVTFAPNEQEKVITINVNGDLSMDKLLITVIMPIFLSLNMLQMAQVFGLAY